MTLAENTLPKIKPRGKNGQIMTRHYRDNPPEDPRKPASWNRAREATFALGLDPMMTTQRGKLFFMRQITEFEFEALNRYARDLEMNDRIVLGRRRTPSPPSLERQSPGTSPDDLERIHRFEERFNEARKALLTAGRTAEGAVNRLCRDESSGAMLAEARRGLAPLIVFYGLAKGKK